MGRMKRWLGGWVLLVGLIPTSAEASTLDLGVHCQSDAACAPYPDTPWCNPESGICWTCSDSAQCADEDEVCESGACVRPCAEDLDCSADEPICDIGEGHCVMCLSDDGCVAAEHCAHGTCRVADCSPGEVDCRFAGRLAQCQDNGGGWDVLQDCWAQGQECLELDGTPMCVTEGDTTGDAAGDADGTGSGTTAADDDAGQFDATAEGEPGADGDGTGGSSGTPAAEGCRSGGTIPTAGVFALLLPVWLRRRAGALSGFGRAGRARRVRSCRVGWWRA